MPSFGESFIYSSLHEGKVEKFLHFGKLDHLFKGDVEKLFFNVITEHVQKYGKLPSIETFEQVTKQKVGPEGEPPEFHLDRLRNRYVDGALKKAVNDAGTFLEGTQPQPMKALESLITSLTGVVVGNNQDKIFDFRQALDLIYADYKAKMLGGDDYGIQTGWPTLDEMTGGLLGGDLISIVGRPAQGKSWFLLFMALYTWYVSKKPVAFFSMEMSKLSISTRLAAMQAHISATQIKNADLTTKALAALTACLKDIKNHPVPFYIIDGTTTPNVRDAITVCRQLAVAAAWVDGAYLFKHPTERDRYKRVSENVDLLKFDWATALNIPVTASWQFAKTGAKSKLKKGEKASLEDIGYSDAIGQHSSIVLGLLEEDSIETIEKRRVEVLKGRSGEVGFFETNWDFNKMDFSEVVTEKNVFEFSSIADEEALPAAIGSIT